MDDKLYTGKDPKDFADGWQGFAKIKVAIDKATRTKRPVIPVQYWVTPQMPPSRVLTPPDLCFVRKKPSALFVHDKDFGQSLLPVTEMFRELHAAATGRSSTATKHNPLFPAPTVVPIKPLATVAARVSDPPILRRSITPVTAPAQPTARPTPSHPTAAAQPTHNVTLTQAATQQSPTAAPSRTRSVHIAALIPNPVDDDAGNNNRNRFASSTPPRSFRRSQSVPSTGTSGIGDSNLKFLN